MSDTPNENQTQTQDTQNTNRPLETLRDGRLKAAIWRNEGERGTFYTTTLTRTYRDADGQFHDSQTFRNDDLLRLGELTRQAHHRTNDLAREDFTRQRSERGPKKDQTRDLTR